MNTDTIEESPPLDEVADKPMSPLKKEREAKRVLKQEKKQARSPQTWSGVHEMCAITLAGLIPFQEVLNNNISTFTAEQVAVARQLASDTVHFAQRLQSIKATLPEPNILITPENFTDAVAAHLDIESIGADITTVLLPLLNELQGEKHV